MADYPWVFPEGRRELGPEDIDRTIATLWKAWAGMLMISAILALI